MKLSLAIILLSALPAFALAQMPPDPSVGMPGGGQVGGGMMPGGGGQGSPLGKLPSVFAYPGKSCPNGSTIYPGPESQMAEADGAVYCVFTRKVVVLKKTTENNGKCPGRLTPYEDAKFKPPSDQIWCNPPTQDPAGNGQMSGGARGGRQRP